MRRRLGPLNDETNERAEPSDKQEGHPEFDSSYLRLEFGEDAGLSLLLAFFKLGQSLVNVAAKIVACSLDLFTKLFTDATDLSTQILADAMNLSAKLLADAVDLSAQLLADSGEIFADSREIGPNSGNVVFGGQVLRRSEENIQECACVVLRPVELVDKHIAHWESVGGHHEAMVANRAVSGRPSAAAAG